MSDMGCNLCGSSRKRVLFSKNGIAIAKCEECGLLYVYPSISDDKVRKLYAKKEWKPPEIYTEDYSSKNRVAILKMLEPAGKLLDVGCGYGRFLGEASKIYETSGIDISSAKVKFGRENLHLNIIEGDIYKVSFPQRWFDIVTLIRVIEHLKDVSKALRKINRLMKIGGLLFIKTGNIGGRRARKKGKKWEYFDPPYHLFYFSQRNIKKLLKMYGFKVIKITPGNLDINRLLGYLASNSRRYLFPFAEFLLSIKEYLKGNSMMDVYAKKITEL
jgi:ubiquinone/menaquinone biosynthesis C-methylase UbiE